MNRWTIILAACTWASPLMSQTIRHPLDPLSWQEYWTVLEVLREANHLDADTRFSIIQLDEPIKQIVRDWQPGRPIPRSAYTLVRQKKQTYEAVVDLVQHRLLAWTEVKNAQPSWLEDELTSMGDVIKKHPDFVAAMKRRGITDFTFIDIIAIPPRILRHQGTARSAHRSLYVLRRPRPPQHLDPRNRRADDRRRHE